MHFLVHNGSRDQETRLQRAMRPTHDGLKQFIMNGQRRLLRGRPVQISFEQLQQYLEEFQEKEKQGILYVTTVDGRVVNLYDPKFQPAPPPPLVNPRPNPPLDSANNDDMSGLQMNAFNREPPPPETFVMPVEPPVAAIENNPVAPSPEQPSASSSMKTEDQAPAPDLTELAGLEEEPVVATESMADVMSDDSLTGKKKDKKKGR